MNVQGSNVLALVTDAFGGFGGIAQYNRDFLTALSQTASVEHITVLPRTGEAPLKALPAKIHQLPAVGNKLVYAVKALTALRQARRVDILFCGHLYMLPIAVPLARLTGASLWLQIHGIDAWQKPSRLLQWATERADQVTAVSRYTRRRFLSWANIAPEKARVLPNTIDDKFTPGPKLPDLIERYGLRGKKVLLTVSRLAASERYKGHDRVIKALPRVLVQHPDARYLIAGDGDDRPRLEQLAHEQGVAGKVIFAGRVSNDELVDHFRLADLFVMPSSGEGFGIVFLQAVACGVPVIGGNADGGTDALADGTIGQLIDPEDMCALSEAIVNALDTKQSPVFVRERFGNLGFGQQVSLISAALGFRQ